MKRWQVIAGGAVLVVLIAYLYFYPGTGWGVTHGGGAGRAAVENGQRQPVQIHWQLINRPDDGFRLEMPAGPTEGQVQAYNETGGSEPVKILYSTVDGDTTYAITWGDNPPVARSNDRVPDRTLDQARDGMLARTQTTLVKQSKTTGSGFSALEITAKNNGGGLLEARLILMNDRLYTLMALYPSVSARRERDVSRFYDSFTPLRVGTSLPEATPVD
jgi:hypothetical protein